MISTKKKVKYSTANYQQNKNSNLNNTIAVHLYPFMIIHCWMKERWW